MSYTPDPGDRATAEKLVEALLAASDQVNRAAAALGPEPTSPSAHAIKRRLAEAMTIIGWDILECEVFSTYADLRPYELAKPT
jgi:hypothetical protein